MLRQLGRVRFDRMEEGDVVLGEGACGAVKPVRSIHGRGGGHREGQGVCREAVMLKSFRWVFLPVADEVYRHTRWA